MKIGPLGWSDSLRKAWDGYTYFGNLKESLPDPRTGDIAVLNDFVFDVSTQQQEARHRGRHLQVRFCPFQRQYFVKDLGVGGGTFVKLDKSTEIKEDVLLSVGDLFLPISVRKITENLFTDFTNLVG